MSPIVLLACLSAARAETVAYASVSGTLGFLLENVGDYAVGAEHVFGPHHGLLLEGTLIHVHGDPTHSTTKGLQLGYRYHWDRAFVGLVAGYEVGRSKYFPGEHPGPYDAYGLRHLSLIPHIGYRFEPGEHLRVTVRFGAGYGSWQITPEEEGDAAQMALIQDRLQFTPIKLDSELSLGWRF